MKFERITLENFRQYFERQVLELARDRQQLVTVINGVNGAGKTSLFLAINWCLYGDGIENVGELISKEAVKRADTGDSIDMSVELFFSHEGERYLVRRARRGIKMIDESAHVDTSDKFTVVQITLDGQTKTVNNPTGVINSILPVNVRSYFLFDGEKIDNFAKPEAAREVKEAISLVFKMETLDRARRHLEAIASDYRKELRNITTGELQKILDEEERVRNELKNKEDRQKEIALEVEAAKRKIADIDSQLLKIQHVKPLQEERDNTEVDLKRCRSEVSELQNRIRDIVTSSYFSLSQDIIRQALLLLDEKRERGEIPSNIRQQLIQDLIEQMRCICGRPFALDGPEHHQLLKLLNNTLPKALEDDLLELSAILHTFPDRATRQQDVLFDLMQRRVTLMDRIKDLEAKVDEISRQLKGSPLEEVSRLEKQRDDYRADIDQYNVATGELNRDVADLNSRLGDLKNRANRAHSNVRKEKLLGIKVDLAQRAADAIKEENQKYANEMRRKIEIKTKEIFKQLIWKESHYQDIRLSQDFDLEVIDRYNKLARPEMSAGERQILSLSFITAMSKISEEEAPLVMDTPFGRLSSEPRNNVTKFLPDLTEQLILFVTDEELRDEARRNLEPRIGREYCLDFDSTISSTRIREVTK